MRRRVEVLRLAAAHNSATIGRIMEKPFPFDFFYALSTLLLSFTMVHIAYTLVIRPNADAVLAYQREVWAKDPMVQIRRSMWVIMFFLHQIQLSQDRLVLDDKAYVDQYLIRHLRERCVWQSHRVLVGMM